ncbi:MAG: mannose-6-phosphate isomerase, class I [Deltaproteobacteria bacterium]|nr:mannose-6-phosphate isomerase, class I [Deltaproteobacteria bacterium]
MALLKNPVQNYAWGSRTFIPELLGQAPPAKSPVAELWMGAHPKAPSMVRMDGEERSLSELIQERPEEILGKRVAEKFSQTLPFLFKILAASRPLSIQAHPNKSQALEGFERENRLNIPVTAPNRNYRDSNHKPEIICALRPFWAMKGFRPIGEIVDRLGTMNLPSLEGPLRALKRDRSGEGLKHFYMTLMTMDKSLQGKLVAEAFDYCMNSTSKERDFEWVIRLHEEYPGDIGVISPLLLNLVRLEPGEAMFIQAGILHCYLEGCGVELMANSDNVLRGGLTPKHVDVHELLRILNFSHERIDILKPTTLGDGGMCYFTPAEEFLLSVIHLREEGESFTSPQDRSAEILICVQGSALLTELESGDQLAVSKGISVLVPASVAQYRVEGRVKIFKASVPL